MEINANSSFKFSTGIKSTLYSSREAQIHSPGLKIGSKVFTNPLSLPKEPREKGWAREK